MFLEPNVCFPFLKYKKINFGSDFIRQGGICIESVMLVVGSLILVGGTYFKWMQCDYHLSEGNNKSSRKPDLTSWMYGGHFVNH